MARCYLKAALGDAINLFISVMQNTLWSPRERATEKLTTQEVNFSWELAQPRLRQWLYEKGRQDFFIILLWQPQPSTLTSGCAKWPIVFFTRYLSFVAV